MTTPTTGAAELPEALRLAADLSSIFISEEIHATKARKIAAELRRLCQSEREGWRYADELKQDLDRLRAQVEALSAAQAGVPDGYALVPKESTAAMQWAFARAETHYRDGIGRAHPMDNVSAFKSQYAAMLAAAPQPSPSPAPADPDGEAFRTAARLGLTLRFYGGCAQSSIPGTPSAYEVVPGCDRAEAMRKAVAQAAEVIAAGGKAQECGNSPYDEGPFTLSAPAKPGQEGEEGELQPCPCGKTPTALQITGNEQAKWAHVSGNCCGTWEVEYRNNYAKLASPEAMALAKSAWHDADRAARAAPQPATADALDAARYRWLAGHCRSTAEHWGGRWSIIVDGPAPKSHDSEDDFDVAVDAARAAQKGKP